MDFKVDTRGLNQLKSKLRRLAGKVRVLDEEHSVPLSELCPRRSWPGTLTSEHP